MRSPRSLSTALLAAAIASSFLLNGCSMKRMAVNAVGDALAESGSAYASDEDRGRRGTRRAQTY
jgi:hypothetical protein